MGRKIALLEGSIGIIFKKIIGPLVRYKPPGMDIRAFWETLFHIDTRTIKRYLVTKPFKMPGLYCEAPLVKIQGIGFRQVKANEVLWVRTDSTTPDQIDVQWLRPGKESLFELTSSEWGWVKLHLKEREEIR